MNHSLHAFEVILLNREVFIFSAQGQEIDQEV